MAGRLPLPFLSVFDSNGNPLSGAKLAFYQSGTTTPLSTFSDAGLTTPNANPVISDSSGRFADIFLGDGPYKVVLSTSADVVQWTADPVYAANAVGPQNFTLPTVGGTANAITLTYAQPPVSLTAGTKLAFKATAPNTAATTVTVAGATKNLFKKSTAGAIACTGGEIQTGDIVEVEYDGTQFQIMSDTASKVAQVVAFETGAVATGTTVIPLDDTIPQIGEGDLYMTRTFTPMNALSTLVIDVVAVLANSSGAGAVSATLFQDTAAIPANAIAASVAFTPAANNAEIVMFRHKMTAGTVALTTFTVRGGGNAAGTTTFNGSAGARLYGGVLSSSITITEILP